MLFFTATILLCAVQKQGITLRSQDGDGSKNVADKVNSRFFQSSSRLLQVTNFANVGEPS